MTAAFAKIEDVIARAREAWRPPGPAEQRHLRALHELLRCSLRKTRGPNERVGWIKTVAERVIGNLLGEHVRLPERDVRNALEAMGFRVRGDRVWAARLPTSSAESFLGCAAGCG